MQNLLAVEGMSLEALRAGINWEFESFDDYLALIERQGVGPNIAAFVGHSSVRTYVMGSDAPLRSATVAEVKSMRRLVAAAMDAGAVGALADPLLFDPDIVGCGPSRRVWDLLAEQRRLTTDPLGVHGVWVNGTRIVNADGVVPIDNLPGRVLPEF